LEKYFVTSPDSEAKKINVRRRYHTLQIRKWLGPNKVEHMHGDTSIYIIFFSTDHFHFTNK
jgi:hypothetical protein